MYNVTVCITKKTRYCVNVVDTTTRQRNCTVMNNWKY